MKRVKFILDVKYDSKNVPAPVPAQDMIPEWWRNGESFLNKETLDFNIPDKSLRGPAMKSCVPFLDSLTSGYFVLAYENFEIYENNNNTIKMRPVIKDKNNNWIEDKMPRESFMIEERKGPIGYTMPRPEGFAFNHLAFSLPWGWKTPKKWSMLVTHPFNRHDLPFYTTSGIMDSDKFPLAGRVPFFIKDGWTGVIEKGTPLVQLIPIKRETWVSTIGSFSPADLDMAKAVRSVQYGYYRRKIWEKKKYLLQEKNGEK